LVISKLLTSVCSGDIFAYRVDNSAVRIAHLKYTDSTKAILLYRLSTAKFKSIIPLNFGEYNLVALFSDSEYIFRWNDELQFWKAVWDGKQYTTRKVDKVAQSQSIHKLALHWSLAVYCKCIDTDYIDACLTSNIGEQKVIRRPLHDQFLVKQPISCELACCVKRCKKKSRSRCLANGNYCEHGVCFSHGKKFVEDGVVVDVCYDSDDYADSDEFVAGQSSSSIAPDVHNDITDGDLETLSDDDFIFAPIGQETAYDYDDLPANHSRKDMIPIYDIRNSMSSHYLWNQGYGVLNHRDTFCSNVQANAMLQHIVTMSNNASVSLLYPESQLFTRVHLLYLSDYNFSFSDLQSMIHIICTG